MQIIERNLYGADVDRFAVNIAMLRLWLSLSIEYDDAGDPPPLPNLEFKIVRGGQPAGAGPERWTTTADLFTTGRLTAWQNDLGELKSRFHEGERGRRQRRDCGSAK